MDMANKLMKEMFREESERISIEEYCRMLLEGDMSIEYDNGRILLMTSSPAHMIITENVREFFVMKLQGKSCRSFSSQVPVFTPSYSPFRIPDVSIVCGEVEWEVVNGIGALRNPIIIIEVLSPGTEIRDWNEKKHAYMHLETLQYYILIDQYKPVITIYKKNNSGIFERLDILGIQSHFKILDMELSFAEIYKGIEFK